MNVLPDFKELKLEDGNHAIPTAGGWVIHLVVEGGEVVDYSINNLNDKGENRWYVVLPKAYSAPTIIEEPNFGIEIPSEIKLVDVDGEDATSDQKIVGFILRNKSGETIERLSLTNAQMKDIDYCLNGSMLSFEVDELVRFFTVKRLVNANKNRIQGLVAYCYEGADEGDVIISELEDHVTL